MIFMSRAVLALIVSPGIYAGNLTTKKAGHEENFVDVRGIRPSVSPSAYSQAGWSEWMPIFYCCHDKFGGLTQCQGAEETGIRFAASTCKGIMLAEEWMARVERFMATRMRISTNSASS